MALMHALLLITLLSAQPALQELDAMCRADGGKLWGRSLCGPIVLVDPMTRSAVASDGGRVYETKIPDSMGVANTSVDWDGRRWTMVLWPLPDDAAARKRLLAHESFHRVQQDLGFPSTGPSNAHLDSADGRYWLRLEWLALARAIHPSTSARDAKRAIEDALAFRAARHALNPDAAEEERQLEMHEGLAEYTGFALAEPRRDVRRLAIVEHVVSFQSRDSYVRSFAYASGPAWGAAVEMRKPRWTRSLKASDDLGELARRAWKCGARFQRASSSAAQYGGGVIRAEEDARAEKKRQEKIALRAKFIDGPVLTLPLGRIELVFDPNGLQPFDEFGTVYRRIEITDAWGKIVVDGGALLTSDWKRLIVPAGGEGYTLTLNAGWRIVDDARAGDKRVETP